MSAPTQAAGPWGLLAEFETGDQLIAATRKAREAGYTRMDGYSPYPIGEVADELNFPKSEIGAVMFIGGLTGAVLGFCMQAWTTGVDYQLTVAGKPVVSWPMFVPITWELLVLTASMSGFFGLLSGVASIDVNECLDRKFTGELTCCVASHAVADDQNVPA